ncbi:MAG: A24 family peptidase [Burkholderiaceae bacterium]
MVIHRVPVMMQRDWEAQAAELRGEESPHPEPYNLVVPRSACPKCGHKIGVLENIPIVSWLVLRGRCKGCATPISIRYPLVEAATGLLSALAIWHFGATLAGAAAVLLTFFLVSLTGIDLDTQLLPDSMTLPLIWIGLLLNLHTVFVPLPDAVLGATFGYLILWTIFWAFKLLTGKDGMGYGDFKLLAALGAWFGWRRCRQSSCCHRWSAPSAGIGLIVLARHGRQVPIPFGPYLAGAGLLMLYFGDRIKGLYLL